jgi:hypothetical protein
MACSDEDLGKSRRPDADDQGWLTTDRVLCGWMIGRLGDAVYGLYHTQGARVSWLSLKNNVDSFLVCDSKPVAPVWWFVSQNHRLDFLIWASKPSRLWVVGCATKSMGGWFGARHASRSGSLLYLNAIHARIFQSCLKTGGCVMMGGARDIITEVASSGSWR